MPRGQLTTLDDLPPEEDLERDPGTVADDWPVFGGSLPDYTRLVVGSQHLIILFTWAILSFPPTLPASDPATLINRLKQTEAVNITEIVDGQFEEAEPPAGFYVANPYEPDAAEIVETWYRDPRRSDRVCAIRFVDPDRVRYELDDFPSADQAAAAGFTVTHQGRCGSCSTLEDLAVYLAVPDLVTPARRCARKSGLVRKAECFEKTIGFTQSCAETWAWNAQNTRRKCKWICLSDYGLFNLLFHRYPGPNVDESGGLRPCLQCDEDRSGPGFKYSAGRTRRNSGIESAIARPKLEIHPADHSAYFSDDPQFQ